MTGIIFILKWFNIITTAILIKIVSIFIIIFAILIFLFYRKQIFNFGSKFKSQVNELPQTTASEQLKTYYKYAWALPVSVEYMTYDYADVKEGEYKRGYFWVTNLMTNLGFLVRVPLSKGKSAIYPNGDIEIISERPKGYDYLKIKKTAPKQAYDEGLEWLKSEEPETYTKIEKAKLKSKLIRNEIPKENSEEPELEE